ncbi:unnamed protein product [Soboliphyme baturini]|uniref:Tropomyosin n=1 Tax=Soboliphyme baturini TaxID=241478 RepID=A0A183IQ70_9BILA|nr:unnamed protein product [Soboliphyme baturini]
MDSCLEILKDCESCGDLAKIRSLRQNEESELVQTEAMKEQQEQLVSLTNNVAKLKEEFDFATSEFESGKKANDNEYQAESSNLAKVQKEYEDAVKKENNEIEFLKQDLGDKRIKYEEADSLFEEEIAERRRELEADFEYAKKACSCYMSTVLPLTSGALLSLRHPSVFLNDIYGQLADRMACSLDFQ